MTLLRAAGRARPCASPCSRTHYRQPIDWTEKGIADARRTLDHWGELTADAADGAPLCADVLEALQDDLNTPQAIAALHARARQAAKGAKRRGSVPEGVGRGFDGAAAVDAAPSGKRGGLRPSPSTMSKIEALIAARNAARKAKNFKEADRIRDELAAMGVQLKDAKDPATGEIVTTWECALTLRRSPTDGWRQAMPSRLRSSGQPRGERCIAASPKAPAARRRFVGPTAPGRGSPSACLPTSQRAARCGAR